MVFFTKIIQCSMKNIGGLQIGGNDQVQAFDMLMKMIALIMRFNTHCFDVFRHQRFSIKCIFPS